MAEEKARSWSARLTPSLAHWQQLWHDPRRNHTLKKSTAQCMISRLSTPSQVMAEEKARLERQVDSLSGTLAKKEARLRGSVDALAKASYKLRASFTAEVRRLSGGYGPGEGLDLLPYRPQ